MATRAPIYGPAYVTPEAEAVGHKNIRALVNWCQVKRRFRAPVAAEKAKLPFGPTARIVLDEGILVVLEGGQIGVHAMAEFGITGKEQAA